MRTLRDLGNYQQQKDADDFGRLLHFVLKNDGKISQAARRAEENKFQHVQGMSNRTLNILKNISGAQISRGALTKAAMTPIGLTSPLQDVSVIANGFITTLASVSVFDRILPDTLQIPLRSGTVGAITVGATGFQVYEFGMKAISRMSVSAATTTLNKTHVAVVITQELAKQPIGSIATQLIQRQLQLDLGVVTDSTFITSILSGVVPANSFGNTGSAIRQNIDWLLRQVPMNAASKPYLLMTPQVCKTLSQVNNSGQAAFPGLTPLGGNISGIPALVSDSVLPGMVVLLDAGQIVTATSELILEELEEAVLQMDTTPDSPPTGSTTLTSLWQLNQVGIRAERWIIGQKLRSDSVAAITDPNSYITGTGSP
jgi:hypothetical protein